VFPHSSRLLHGAARPQTTMPHPTLLEGIGVFVGLSLTYFPLSLTSFKKSPVFAM